MSWYSYVRTKARPDERVFLSEYNIYYCTRTRFIRPGAISTNRRGEPGAAPRTRAVETYAAAEKTNTRTKRNGIAQPSRRRRGQSYCTRAGGRARCRLFAGGGRAGRATGTRGWRSIRTRPVRARAPKLPGTRPPRRKKHSYNSARRGDDSPDESVCRLPRPFPPRAFIYSAAPGQDVFVSDTFRAHASRARRNRFCHCVAAAFSTTRRLPNLYEFDFRSIDAVQKSPLHIRRDRPSARPERCYRKHFRSVRGTIRVPTVGTSLPPPSPSTTRVFNGEGEVLQF